IAAVKTVIDTNFVELGRLDSIAGDGDHGIGMQRGATAALAAARDVAGRDAGAGTILTSAGDAWADRGGGTSGALWGIALRTIGTEIGDTDAPTAAAIAAAVTSARDAIANFGKAQLGDKTMLDALTPFVDALTARAAAGDGTAEAWRAASVDAQAAADSTADLLPRIGRARPHMEKSLGTPDPGAISLALAIDAIASTLTTNQGDTE
ncbi:MAG: D-erythrulose 4-kinase, partial [Actinomycetota bacterium]|nr:D-erythrulose 4-kinase [Actinomycetota bacterium]